MSKSTAAVLAPNCLAAKFAATGPWKGSRKAARKTQGRSLVVSGLVDQGETMGVWLSLQAPPAGMACLEELGPMMATTLSWVMSFSAALTALSALASLSW